MSCFYYSTLILPEKIKHVQTSLFWAHGGKERKGREEGGREGKRWEMRGKGAEQEAKWVDTSSRCPYTLPLPRRACVCLYVCSLGLCVRSAGGSVLELNSVRGSAGHADPDWQSWTQATFPRSAAWTTVSQPHPQAGGLKTELLQSANRQQTDSTPCLKKWKQNKQRHVNTLHLGP